MNIGVIGAGISGLSIAQMLKEQHNVTVFETKSKIGGLIQCDRVNDCLFHKVGGHVFNAKNSEVLKWFWSFFDKEKEFTSAKRNAKIYLNHQLIGYPIENNLWRLSEGIVKNIIEELLVLHEEKNKNIRYLNFESFLRHSFGNTLYKLYFKPYNTKIWQTDLKEIPIDWLQGKLPMPELSEILTANILKKEEVEMVHSSFYYPKENGSQFIADRLGKDLKIIKGGRVVEISESNGKYRLNDSYYDSIIYTGDIRQLPKCFLEILKNSGVDTCSLKSLKSTSTSNIFCETDDTDISWLYLPENFTRAHRIIYTGNFSTTNNRGSNRKTCVVEFSGKLAYNEMIQEIKKLPGNLEPLAFNFEENSYVIQTFDSRKFVEECKVILERKNIYLLGRFAEWEYYNMDKAIEAAMKLSKKIDSI